MHWLKKYIRLKADADKYTLTEEDERYYNEVLLPMVQKNIEEKKQEKAKRKAVRIKQCKVIFTSLACAVCLSLVVGFTYLMISNQNYAGTYKSKESDINSLNESLIYTQLQDEFEYISMTYKGKKEVPVYYTLNYNYEEIDIDYIICSMRVVTDKTYAPATDLEFNEKTEFKGLTVEFTRTVETEIVEEFTVNTFVIRAFIDTGAERYLFDFEELTINELDSFENYLNLIIKIKE